MAKKRKKQTKRHPSKKEVAHRWVHDKDIPLRERIRGAMGDVRVLGDRDSGIRLTNSIKALDAELLKLLKSRKFDDKARGARILLGAERENNRVRIKDADIAIACIEAHGAEMIELYRQALSQTKQDMSPEKRSQIMDQLAAEQQTAES